MAPKRLRSAICSHMPRVLQAVSATPLETVCPEEEEEALPLDTPLEMPLERSVSSVGDTTTLATHLVDTDACMVDGERRDVLLRYDILIYCRYILCSGEGD